MFKKQPSQIYIEHACEARNGATIRFVDICPYCKLVSPWFDNDQESQLKDMEGR